MNTFRHLILLGTSLLLVVFQSLANDRIFPGYVIHENGNKEKGFILPGGSFDNQNGITFKSGDDEIYYGINELKGYGFEEEVQDRAGKPQKEWVHFEKRTLDFAPVPDGAQTVFLELKAKGKLSLYSVFIELKANVDNKVRQLYLVIDVNDKVMKINELSFMKRSRIIFRDYPALQSRLGKPNFRYDDMARMIHDYNFQKENGHDIDVYKASPVGFAEME